MSLKQKTISGFIWSFIENFSKQGINFVIGIILARLLLPEEFGLVGMITIFIAISTSLINSGFTQALIRKKECTNVDYSTVFFFNLITGVFLALCLFLSAPYIALFFNEPKLDAIVRVFSVVLIFDALSIIQRTQLIKRIDFKLQTKITLIADVTSGIVAITMAYKGFGVWSLVVKQIVARGLTSLLLWILNAWFPTFVFSEKSFKELFGFGSKLLISGLISTIFQNIYLVVIGKYFSAAQLGFFTRADQFKNLPSQNINGVIQRVTYPVLSKLQDDIPKLKESYQKIIRSTMFVTFILMICLGAIAEPLILTLLGDKWVMSIVYLQLLVFVGMFYPLHSLNLNMLNVQGHSNLYLKLTIIKNILKIPVVFVGVIFGIKWMIICMIINTVIAYFLNSYYSGKYIGYSSMEQLKDIFPSFVVALLIGSFLFIMEFFLNISAFYMLVLQIFAGMILTIMLGEFFKIKDYFFIKTIIVEQIKKVRK